MEEGKRDENIMEQISRAIIEYSAKELSPHTLEAAASDHKAFLQGWNQIRGIITAQTEQAMERRKR